MDMTGYRGKVPASYVTEIARRIAPFDTDATREQYRNRDIPRADSVKDIDKRFRHDLAYAAGCVDLFCDLYDIGCDDSHIDTALRFIVPIL